MSRTGQRSGIPPDPRSLVPRPGEAEMLAGVDPLLRSIVARYARARTILTEDDRDDLLSDARLIALGVVRRFEPERGYQLTTMVVPSVTQNLLSRASVGRSVIGAHIPTMTKDETGERRAARDKLQARGITRIDWDPDKGSLPIPDTRETDPAAGLMALDERLKLAARLLKLRPRERTVIARRFGLGGPAGTLDEVAAEIGLSRERVRQIENEALGKLGAVCKPPTSRRGRIAS